jgi:hypothetical protein
MVSRLGTSCGNLSSRIADSCGGRVCEYNYLRGLLDAVAWDEFKYNTVSTIISIDQETNGIMDDVTD